MGRPKPLISDSEYFPTRVVTYFPIQYAQFSSTQAAGFPLVTGNFVNSGGDLLIKTKTPLIGNVENVRIGWGYNGVEQWTTEYETLTNQNFIKTAITGKFSYLILSFYNPSTQNTVFTRFYETEVDPNLYSISVIGYTQGEIVTVNTNITVTVENCWNGVGNLAEEVGNDTDLPIQPATALFSLVSNDEHVSAGGIWSGRTIFEGNTSTTNLRPIQNSSVIGTTLKGISLSERRDNIIYEFK